MTKGFVVAALVLTGLSGTAWAGQDKPSQASIVGAELSAIANQLSLRPETAIDFSKVSGEYCFFTGWDAHHTHYAIDPGKTQEDLIDFADARPLIQQGIDLSSLPALPEGLGKMVPKQWYYLAPGGEDPHHGDSYQFPVLLRATDLN